MKSQPNWIKIVLSQTLRMANLAENIPLVNKDCKKKADFLCHLISQYFKTYSFVDINFQLVAYRYRNSSGPQIKRGTSVVQK